MKHPLTAALAIAATLIASPTGAQQTPASGQQGVRRLVYEFGYNTPAASQGNNTGKVTIDITGLAHDGAKTISTTDHWWNSVNPRPSNTCEVYPNGGVTCSQGSNAISLVQLAVVPLLGQNYFAPLSESLTSSWQQKYNVRATLDPRASSGLEGDVYTWACAYTLTGKGTTQNGVPLMVIHSEGTMKQQGGQNITVSEKADILYDPRIKMPVLVDQELTFPTISDDRYTVELKLISV